MVWLYLKLAFATTVILAPGWIVARTLGVRSIAATLAWSLTVVFCALLVVFALGTTLTAALAVLAAVALAGAFLGWRRGWPPSGRAAPTATARNAARRRRRDDTSKCSWWEAEWPRRKP